MCKVFCHNTQCLSSQTSVQYVFQILLFFIRQRWRIAKGYLKCCTKFVNLSGKKLYTLSGSDATVACPTCTAVNACWSAYLGNWLVHKCEQAVPKLWHLATNLINCLKMYMCPSLCPICACHTADFSIIPLSQASQCYFSLVSSLKDCSLMNMFGHDEITYKNMFMREKSFTPRH